MGRYYKTANPQNIDFMYQLPEQYMLAAVQQASQDITQNQAAMYDLYGKLQLDALSKDKPRAKQIIDSYEESINEIAAELQSDPLAFRRKGGDLLGLSRKLNKEFTKGEAAAIQSNYNIDAKWQADYDKLAREGKLEHANWIQALRAKNLERYQGVGYNQSTGNYNSYSPEDLVNYVDIDKELAEKVKEIEKKITATAYAGVEGEFIRESGKTTQKRTKNQILSVAMEEFYSDPKIQAFIKQGSDIGMLSGYYNKDEEGNLTKQISPFKRDENGEYLVDKDKNLIENPESAAMSKFNSMITRFEVDNITAAHNRLKALPSTGSKNPGDPLPAIIDGSQTVNPIGYTGDMSTPEATIKNEVKNLTNPVNDKEILTDAFSHLQSAVNNKFFDGNTDATKQIAQIGELVKKGDVKGLEQMLKGSPDSGWVRNIKDAVREVKNNHVKAQNMQAQLDAYTELAKSVNTKNGTNYTANDLMLKATEITQPVVETRGEYYDFRPEHQTKFDKVVTDVNKQIDDEYKLGHSMIVWKEDAKGRSSIVKLTNEEFNDLFKVIEEDKRSKSKAGTTGGNASDGTKVGRPTSIDELDASDKSSSLNPTGKVGNNIQMITGKIAYEYKDDDGNTKTATLVQPFTKKLKTANGEKVTIIYPRERVNSSDLNDLDVIYRAKNEVELKTTDVNNMVLGIEKVAEAAGIDFDVPTPFKFNDNTLFSPNVGRGIGTYKVNGKVALEDEDIYQEYEKTMNQ
jgi:hypothetical protein